MTARQRLASETFDLLVIGGGINGCGIARDAAMRGLRVALVEKDDFGSGTSGRTSRLIHGGLRYLEHGHLGLVAESLRERRTLLEIAPHLVTRLPFTWPVYRGARITRGKVRAGMFAYDLLSLRSGSPRHRVLDPEGVIGREPELSRADLVGGVSYSDAQTDDARLTLANALSAAYWGAVVVNHMSAEPAAGGASVTDEFSGDAFDVDARLVVRAVGPWSSSARRSKGAHIAVPRESVGNRGAVTLLSPVDARVMFVLPDGPRAIVGTTDTITRTHPDEVRASRTDVDYLLESVRRYFPRSALTHAGVLGAWAAVRPLARALDDGDPADASREHSISRARRGLIEVTGGKLTTYRSVAEETVDLAEVSLGKRRSPCRTAVESLPGADRVAAVRGLIQGNPDLGKPLDAGTAYCGADMVYAAKHEIPLTLSDLLMRRTRLAFETADHGLAASARAAELVAPLLGWTAADIRSRLEDYRRDVERIFSIDP